MLLNIEIIQNDGGCPTTYPHLPSYDFDNKFLVCAAALSLLPADRLHVSSFLPLQKLERVCLQTDVTSFPDPL